MLRGDRLCPGGPLLTRSTEDVVARLHGDLAAFVRRRVGDPDAAADVLQETWLRIHAGLGDLRDDDRVAAWVYRIARRAIADHGRRARPDAPLAGEVAAPAAPDENWNDVVGGWLAAMVDALPAPYREAVRLAEVDGVPRAEIAARLGLSVSGAKSRVQRGRALLRRRLLDCCHVETDGFGNVVAVERRGGCPVCRAG